MDIHIKNPRPPASKPDNPNRVSIDHETGTIHVPGSGRLPLVGPTSGQEYEQLKKKEGQHRQLMAHLQRQMRSVFQCTQCKRKQKGTIVRVKWIKMDGVNAETLVCFDPHCDAPVVMIQDALSLTAPPGGDHTAVETAESVRRKRAEDEKKAKQKQRGIII